MVEFFTENHWDKLPTSWRRALDSISDVSFLAKLLRDDVPLVLPPQSYTCETTTNIANEAQQTRNTTNTNSTNDPPKTSNPWPLSLLAFRQACHSLSLPRTNGESDQGSGTDASLECYPPRLDQSLEKRGHQHANQSNQQQKLQYKDEMDHLLRRHVKPKKQHEIERLSRLIDSVCDDCEGDVSTRKTKNENRQRTERTSVFNHRNWDINERNPESEMQARNNKTSVCDVSDRNSENEIKEGTNVSTTKPVDVVDFGAGKGHLSRVLAYALGRGVVCLEADEKFSGGAKKYDAQVEKELVKKKKKGKAAKNGGKENLAMGESQSNHDANSESIMISPVISSSFSSSSKALLSLDHPRHVTLKLHPQISATDFQNVLSPSNEEATPDSDCCKGRNGSLDNGSNHEPSKDQLVRDMSLIEADSLVSNDGASDVIDCQTDKKANNDKDAKEKAYYDNVNSEKNDNDKGNEDKNDNDKVNEEKTDNDKAVNEKAVTKSFVLAGLHACGDLSTAMLRLFVEVPPAVGVVSVACCYMKLSERAGGSSKDASSCSDASSEDATFDLSSSKDLTFDSSSSELSQQNCLKKSGYPMSDTTARIPGHYLSYEAKELSCHALENYAEKLETASSDSLSLRLHCHRAALEAIIREVDPLLVKPQVRGGKPITSLPFWDYVSGERYVGFLR